MTKTIFFYIFTGVSFDDVLAPSNLIKEENTALIAIGVRNVNITQIYEIASYPAEDFAITIQSFNELRSITKPIAQRIQLCFVVRFGLKTSSQQRWEFASKPSERPTRSYCCDAQKYFLFTLKSAIIQKYLIMEPPEK